MSPVYEPCRALFPASGTFCKAFGVPKLSEVKPVVVCVCNLQKLWGLHSHVGKLIEPVVAFCISEFCCIL